MGELKLLSDKENDLMHLLNEYNAKNIDDKALRLKIKQIAKSFNAQRKEMQKMNKLKRKKQKKVRKKEKKMKRRQKKKAKIRKIRMEMMMRRKKQMMNLLKLMRIHLKILWMDHRQLTAKEMMKQKMLNQEPMN